MQIRQNLGNLKERMIIARALRASVASLVIFTLGFVLLPTARSEANAAVDLSFEAEWGALDLELDPDVAATNTAADPETEKASSAHGDIDFGSIIPTVRTAGASSAAEGNVGTLFIMKKTIGVKTRGKYYSVFLSTDSSSNNLTASTDAGFYIEPIEGTFASPSKYTHSGWGVAVPGIAGKIDDTTEFASASVYSGNLDKSMTYTSDENVYKTVTWAQVPTATNAQQIWKNTTDNANGFYSGNGDTFDVYYSVVANTDTLAGVYSNRVVYTAMASADAIDRASTNISRDVAYGTGGETETLAFDLATSVPTGAISQSDVSVYLVKHSDVVAGNYDASNLGSAEKWACPVTDFSIDNQKAALTCTIPSANNPVADSSANTSTEAGTKGRFDFWVHIDGYDYNYISRTANGAGTRESFAYVGLQSRYDDNGTLKNYVTEMQEMTPSICNNTNTWGTGTVDSARVYGYTGTGIALASTANASAAIGVGTFLLGDNRETVTSGGQAGTNYKTYLVRRLADGNCWMVQNLDLNLADFTSGKGKRLTSENTNLNTKDIWIPDANFSAYRSVLEPGPSGGLSNLSVASYQFQPRNTFGPNLYWGSRYQANTTTDNTGTANNNGLVIANNANSAFARSYNYDLAYFTGTQNVKNPTNCAADATEGVSWNGDCQQNGQIGQADGSITSVTSSDGTDQDTTWQPSTITSNTDTTFTMRGSNYLGDYYNWYAATAESGTWNTTSGNIQDDICPKGWRLPRNSGTGSWDDLIKTTYQLTSSYGHTANNRQQLNKIMQLPLSIPLAGAYAWANGALNNRGIDGLYWSSTPSSTGGALTLGMSYVGYLDAQFVDKKAYGFSVRCTNRDPEADAAVSTCAAGKICYSANGGSGSMGDQTPTLNSGAATDVILTASSFTRLGYAFAGWSTQKNGFGTVYGPNETVTIADGELASSGLQLYAKWLPASTQYTMQSFDTTACNNLGTHQVIALRDIRDNNVYTVSKLKDGNCWMTSNLALNLADFAGTHNLTPENTDLNSTAAVSRGYWDPSESMYNLAKSIDSSVTKDQSSYFPVASLNRLGTAQNAQFQSENQYGANYHWGSKCTAAGVCDASATAANNALAEMPRSYNNDSIIGGYYNWYSATAESGTYAMTNGDAPDSVCPKGWRMPTQNNTQDFTKLFFTIYGFTYEAGAPQIRTRLMSFLNRGYYKSNGGNDGGGTEVWYSTAINNGNAGSLDGFMSGIVTERGDAKNLGLTVRCIKK